MFNLRLLPLARAPALDPVYDTGCERSLLESRLWGGKKNMTLLATLHNRFVNSPPTVESAIHANHTPHTPHLDFQQPSQWHDSFHCSVAGGEEKEQV